MPEIAGNIPFYQRRVSIPGEAQSVPEPIGSAGIVGEAIQKFGQQGQAFGAELVQTAARLERQKEDAMLIEAGSKINDAFITFRTDYEKNNKGLAATGSQQKASDFTATLFDQYKIDGNERYNNEIRKHIAAQDHVLKNHLAAYEAAQIKDYSKDARSLDLESSKKMAQTGDYNLALINYQKTLDAQKANGSLSEQDHQIETLKGKSDIAEAYIRSRDPIGAKTAFDLLKGDLLADVREKIEPHIKAAAAQRSGLDIGTDVFKGNPNASVMEMTDKIRAMKLDVEVEKVAVGQVKELKVEQKADEQMKENDALDKISTYLLGKTKATKGYIMPSHLSGPAWEEFKAASPKKALEMQDAAERNIRTLSIQNKQDKMAALQLKKMQEDENADNILKDDNFRTRDIRRDYVTGKIGISQFKTLTEIQDKMDPLKHDAVKAALNKINTGKGLVKALNLENENEIAVWKLKYTDLVKQFAVKNAGEADFDKKLNEFMEKSVLSDMVTSWFSLDETDRQRKFQEAQKAAGVKPIAGQAKNRIGTSGGKPVYDLGNGKWQVGD